MREDVDVPDVLVRVEFFYERRQRDAEAEPQPGQREKFRQRAHEQEVRQFARVLSQREALLVRAEVEERFVNDERAADRRQPLREVHERVRRDERARRVVRIAEHDGFGLRALRFRQQRLDVDGEAAFFFQ